MTPPQSCLWVQCNTKLFCFSNNLPKGCDYKAAQQCIQFVSCVHQISHIALSYLGPKRELYTGEKSPFEIKPTIRISS